MTDAPKPTVDLDLRRLADDVRHAQDALLELRPLPALARGARSLPLVPMLASAAVAALLVVVVQRAQATAPAAPATAPSSPASLAVVDANGAPAGMTPLAVAAPAAIRVSDGSVVIVDDGRATLRELTAERGFIALEQGRASLSLPRATSTAPGWIVEAGAWRIDARGARVDVAFVGDRLTVRVGDGEAHVTSTMRAAGVEIVRAGEERAWPETAAVEAGGAPAPPRRSVAAVPPLGTPAVDVDATAHDAPSDAIDHDGDGPTWQELARDDRHSDAMNLARAHVDDIVARASIDDVELLATSARLGASADVARRALLAIRERAPGSVQAARAAFFLGVLADRAGDDDEALAQFARYAIEAPEGELASQASGRTLEVGTHARKDMRDEARAYLQRWPDGAHRALAARIAKGAP